MGGAFDALVRSIRGMADRDRQVAIRLLAQWKNLPDADLTIGPLTLTTGGVVAVEAGEHTGRWLLPAFMAGLTSVRLREGATPEALMALALELSSLSATEAAVERFSSWLWSDGAEGFDVRVERSFADGAGVADTGRAAGLLAVRGATAVAMDGAVAIATVDLDRAAARDELAVSLNLFVQGAQARAFDVSPEVAARLRIDVDDAGHWAQHEIAAVLANESLRALVPPSRIAAGLLARLETHVLPLLPVVSDIAREPGKFHRAVFDALVAGGISETLARAFPSESDGASAERLAALLELLPLTARRSFAQTWLERAASKPAQREPFLALANRLGPARLHGLLDVNALTERGLLWWTRALLEEKKADALPELFNRLAVERWTIALSVVPTTELSVLHRHIERALVGGGRPGDEMIEALLKDARPLVVNALLDGHGHGWGGKAVHRVAKQAAADAKGRTRLVELVRARKAPETVRLAAIAALEGQAELEEAVRWRMAEMLEPASLRSKLETLRERIRDKKEAANKAQTKALKDAAGGAKEDSPASTPTRKLAGARQR